MSDTPLPETAYVGEILLFAGSFIPTGFLLCDGSWVNYSDYEKLGAALGSAFGTRTQGPKKNPIYQFRLPDLRGRTPIGTHFGDPGHNVSVGQQGGSETMTIKLENMTQHSHGLTPQTVSYTGEIQTASNQGNPTASPGNGVPFNTDDSAPTLFESDSTKATGSMAGAHFHAEYPTLGTTGGGQPMTNIQPELALNFIICYQGYFPNP